MSQMTLLGAAILIGLIFTFINHPLAMGLVLLFQTLLVALLSGLTASSFWFSYILFLVFLGGMLVLFIYVASLASNEMFSSSSPLWLAALFSFSSVFLWSLLVDPSLTMSPETSLITPSFDWGTSTICSVLLKFYNSPTHSLTLLLVLYLLLTLVAVVSITKIFKGPLRPQN